ncbi:hypothetical protein SJAG_06596 [Schizosaccharomyces japonicus yFS275]|uniref:Uncharacterized protein n=1 Tax=Schizosaccharomyces japonicus (strain yFS275 / FY16936) TaxID=402676 RepID=T0S184_SCHJY|nr:hypothetical protein SJAG_06596 [Schizosaccharomyces japonicus yFS275]EQC53072.1 hypothetical protein SJAG_06596 [Schizosaccharomyces japonicus yFS275]
MTRRRILYNSKHKMVSTMLSGGDDGETTDTAKPYTPWRLGLTETGLFSRTAGLELETGMTKSNQSVVFVHNAAKAPRVAILSTRKRGFDRRKHVAQTRPYDIGAKQTRGNPARFSYKRWLHRNEPLIQEKEALLCLKCYHL